MRHIISLLMENEAGALSRVSGLFSGRGYMNFPVYEGGRSVNTLRMAQAALQQAAQSMAQTAQAISQPGKQRRIREEQTGYVAWPALEPDKGVRQIHQPGETPAQARGPIIGHRREKRDGALTTLGQRLRMAG